MSIMAMRNRRYRFYKPFIHTILFIFCQNGALLFFGARPYGALRYAASVRCVAAPDYPVPDSLKNENLSCDHNIGLVCQY